MRFNKYLQTIANAYRMDFLASTDDKDRVQRPELWTDEKVGFQFPCYLRYVGHQNSINIYFSLFGEPLGANIFVFT